MNTDIIPGRRYPVNLEIERVSGLHLYTRYSNRKCLFLSESGIVINRSQEHVFLHISTEYQLVLLDDYNNCRVG